MRSGSMSSARWISGSDVTTIWMSSTAMNRPSVNAAKPSHVADDAPRAHLGAPDNIAARFPVKVGDADRAFAGAAHVFREKIHQHRGGAFFMECRGAIAHYDAGTDAYTLYVSSQGSHRQKRTMLELFELGDHQLRVVTPDVGGGFGLKCTPFNEDALVLWASRRCGRPVKWTGTRSDALMGDNHARDQVIEGELALDAKRQCMP